jgi:NitT/TauT family transport system ATP-binding protein
MGRPDARPMLNPEPPMPRWATGFSVADPFEGLDRPLIEIGRVSMTFRDSKGEEVSALRDVSLDIKRGEFVSLLGPSGCGKTTLLRIIADLLEPSAGSVRIGGLSPRENRLRQKYGIVFQAPVLFEWRSVRNNVRLPLEIMGIDHAERERRVDEQLDLVGLSSFADSYPSQLSGGMQQRVGIARALAIKPELLLMDEPFSALDEFTREKLNEDLLAIWRKTRKTVVFVTHNITEAVFLSDRVFVLSPHPGRLSAVIDISLPRPRSLEMRDTPEFVALVSKIRRSFEGANSKS